MDDALVAKGITKKYKDVVAVKGLDLSIKQGELFSLLGTNGAGKSTTVKMLSTLIAPDSGNITVLGFDARHNTNAIRPLINVSWQETAVAQNLTVKENLLFAAGIYGVSKKSGKIEELTDMFSLETVLDKKAKTLSGGWQRRLSVALSLVNSPQILILDEPTLGMDVLARKQLWDIIKSLKGKITVILTTHYMQEAEELSDRVGIMLDGDLVLCGTVAEIKIKTGAESLEKAFISVAERGEN